MQQAAAKATYAIQMSGRHKPVVQGSQTRHMASQPSSSRTGMYAATISSRVGDKCKRQLRDSQQVDTCPGRL